MSYLLASQCDSQFELVLRRRHTQLYLESSRRVTLGNETGHITLLTH